MNLASSTKNPRYSVIIVTYNSRENIQVCLDSLRRCAVASDSAAAQNADRSPSHLKTGTFEYIVVDNNSRDKTADYLSNQNDVRAILNTTNNGFSKGCNQGAEIAKGEYLIFLNPDTLVTTSWADKMARYFQDSAVGAVGPVSNYVAGLQRLDLNLPEKWKNATEFPGKGPIEISESVAKILSEANEGKGILSKILIGFCLMMKRSVYSSMSGMDENLFLGNDDLDISWRLKNNGKKLVVATDAFVFHEGQKSFKTEAKSHVDQLTQESTDALYKKLVAHYGNVDKVPSPLELWGIGWFSPSPECIESLKQNDEKLKHEKLAQKYLDQMEEEMNSTITETAVWKGLSTVIYVAPNKKSNMDLNADERLAKTLNSLPSYPGPDVLVLNCSGKNLNASVPEGTALRKLDLGATCSLKQALDIAINLLPGSHSLFCVAGIEFSTLFNHWMDKRELEQFGTVQALPLQNEGANKNDLPSALAFVARKDWLRMNLNKSQDQISSTQFMESLTSQITLSQKQKINLPTLTPPWLMVQDEIAKNFTIPTDKKINESWTPVEATPLMSSTDSLGLYPDSLREPMKEAKEIGFAGTEVEAPPTRGSFKVLNSKGEKIVVENQDLIILRVTPDLIDGISERIQNIHKQATKIKKLILVFDGNQAKGTKASENNLLVPLDLTPNGMRALLQLAGFKVTEMKPYIGFPEIINSGTTLEGWSQIESIPRNAELVTRKLVSIIILGFNQVEYTKKCIESIRKYTTQNYELILVNNGSKDETKSYFDSIPNAKVIDNKENLGVAKGWNQGLRIAKGEYLLILNNDIIVGPNWLENMVRLAESDSTIGLVGPRSNYIAGPQIVKNVSYKHENEIQGFISKWQSEHDLSSMEFGFIKGFCHLIPRSVYEKVGLYDERFGKGNFEDDDYCLRVNYHGYRALIANDSFIHHYGSVSFKQESVDWQALMIENQKKYTDKWSKGSAAIHETFIDTIKASAPVQSTVVSKSAVSTPSSPILEAGQLAYSEGNVERARALFLEAQGLEPMNADVYCNLGVVQFHLSSLQDGAALFLKCLNINPNHIDAAQNLIDVITESNGQVTLDDIESLVERYPNNPIFKEWTTKLIQNSSSRSNTGDNTKIQNWEAEVESLITQTSFSKALDIIESKLKQGTDDAQCYSYLGIIAHTCGDTHQAWKHFTASLKIRPHSTDTLINAFDTAMALKNIDSIIPYLNHSAKTLPDQREITAMQNHILQYGKSIYSGKNFETLQEISETIKSGEEAMKAGHNSEAIKIFLEALKDRPENPQAMNGLGIIAFGEKRYADAYGLFEAAVSMHPTDQDILLNLWQSAQSLKREKEVLPKLKYSLEQNPNLTDISAVIKEYA